MPEPYNNLAVIYAGQGQYEKAKSELEMAIRTHPTYATAHENLGDIYAKMASQAYDRALQLEKSNTNTKTKLALIRELFSKNARITKSAVTAQAKAAPATKPAAPAVVATQAAPPKPAVTVAVLDKDVGNEALKATHDWAAAWSAKNINKYLASYVKDFKKPGYNHNAWVAQRKARIAAPKSIHVEILDAKTKVVDDNHVSVSFKQHYRASHLNSFSNKTLEWVKSDGQWLIAEERSEK